MNINWKAYFIFSEKELKAIIVIGTFIIVSCSASILFPTKTIVQKRFYFDPNTLDSISAIQLGFLPKHFNTLSTFRNKGGRFYKSTDLLKWYGVPKAHLKTLLPYVRIAGSKTNRKKYPTTVPWLDINKASFNDLVGLGMHSSLARRMIRYREYLGGYQSIGQLKKVYGMTEDAYQLVKPYLLPIRAKKVKMHWSTMNYTQMTSLGILAPRDIWAILRHRKETGKEMRWEEVVSRFDLSREEAYQLKARTDIR